MNGCDWVTWQDLLVMYVLCSWLILSDLRDPVYNFAYMYFFAEICQHFKICFATVLFSKCWIMYMWCVFYICWYLQQHLCGYILLLNVQYVIFHCDEMICAFKYVALIDCLVQLILHFFCKCSVFRKLLQMPSIA